MADRRFRGWHPWVVRDDKNPATHVRELSQHDLGCLQAVWNGAANADQQQRAAKVILGMTGYRSTPWVAEENGGARESDFLAGMNHLGQQLHKLFTVPFAILTGETQTKPDRPARRTGRAA